MEKYIFDKSNGLWYELQGDCYVPCLTVPAEEERPIGIWGQRLAQSAGSNAVGAADEQHPGQGHGDRKQ